MHHILFSKTGVNFFTKNGAFVACDVGGGVGPTILPDGTWTPRPEDRGLSWLRAHPWRGRGGAAQRQVLSATGFFQFASSMHFKGEEVMPSREEGAGKVGGVGIFITFAGGCGGCDGYQMLRTQKRSCSSPGHACVDVREGTLDKSPWSPMVMGATKVASRSMVQSS